MADQVLEVPAVHCDHCVSSIEGAVSGLSGVEKVKVNLESKDVAVSYDDSKVSVEAIVGAIEEQGYDVGASAGGSSTIQIGHRPE